MSLLRELNRLKALRPLDDALAHSLRRLDPDTHDDVLAAAALASLAVAQGHAGFDPANPRRLVDADVAWPQADAWIAQLAASRFVATPDTPEAPAASAPLVLEHGLLYLRRYREYERRLALQLRRIASHPMAGTGLDAIAPLFAQIFPSPLEGEGGAQRRERGEQHDDAQARAAALALRRALLLVTGGPGTGKTTTIARLLVLRIAQARADAVAPPRIALAAPTGRAADRMAESLRQAAQGLRALGIDDGLLDALPTGASTLHRLLGVIPESPDFRHHAGHPLPLDLLVVDEASMVDLPLMCKLAEAVPDGAQLILLGDPDQLPSVEAGDVLAAILEAAGAGEALRPDDADALQPLLGDAPRLADAPAGLHGHRVHLRRGWRQHDSLQLAPLAEAVRAGDAARTLDLLRPGQLANVHRHEADADPLQDPALGLLAHFRALAAATDPAVALRQTQRLRLLTALREGPHGARGLNARIEAALSGRRIGSPPAWYPGRLLLVTENTYRHGLFNGDVGICLPDAEGALLAWFAEPGGHGARAFHPAALPAHDSAFAMTVHKAQGSEFDTVWLQLPRQDARVLSRELLYTGITRARAALHVAGGAEVIAAALSRHASRVSGLGWRLSAAVG
ncbi:exodeoxyribonuclease V subunit alpha [Thermomonas mangrovi]|uniref:exodeoxyribonuclease V subunit alpha n=1 Tax=Thermomonas mangrovi TaxID=2993316 RepID=UPI0023080040|nr:exodeoxyribonuclease V subunit alpha [Thermomonas mangrovi]